MKLVSTSLVLASVLAATIGPAATAQTLIYDNGPIIPGGPVGLYSQAWEINSGFSVSDSFTVARSTTLTSATAGIWDVPGYSLDSVAYAIGTTPGASDISSGVSNPTDIYQFKEPDFSIYDIYLDSFSIDGHVGPGTYYLTLSNAVAGTIQENSVVGWDINNGPSVAYGNIYGNLEGLVFPGSNSDSFQIYGNVTPVTGTPEPGAYAMAMGLGLSGWAALRRRRKLA